MRRRPRTSGAVWALFVVVAALAGCSDEDPPPTQDGAADAPVSESGISADLTVDVAPGQDLPALQALVRRTCTKIAASCEQAQDALGQNWSASITPWSVQQCEKVQLCTLGLVGQMCIDQLLTFYNCMDTTTPFDCAGCLNQLQFVHGACPCLKMCDPSCP